MALSRSRTHLSLLISCSPEILRSTRQGLRIFSSCVLIHPLTAVCVCVLRMQHHSPGSVRAARYSPVHSRLLVNVLGEEPTGRVARATDLVLLWLRICEGCRGCRRGACNRVANCASRPALVSACAHDIVCTPAAGIVVRKKAAAV